MKNIIINASIVATILNVSGWNKVINIDDTTIDPVWDEVEFTYGDTDYRLRVEDNGEVWQCHTSSAREPGYAWTNWEYAGGVNSQFSEVAELLEEACIAHPNPIVWCIDTIGDIDFEEDGFEVSLRNTEDGWAVAYRLISEEGETKWAWTEWELI